MNGPVDHLNDEQLQSLVTFSSENEEAPAPDQSSLASAREHLVTCSICNHKFELLNFAQASLNTAMLGDPTSTCPGYSDWLQITSGLSTYEETTAHLTHAGGCRKCLQLLRTITKTLQEDHTSDEEVLWASLDSSLPDRIKDLSLKLQRKVHGKRKPFNHKSVRLSWVLAASGVPVIIIISLFVLRSYLTSDQLVHRLLAQAYSENRTLELRIPGARYAPMATERDLKGSMLEKPSTLLKASSIIKDNLKLQPNSSKWLAAKAEVDVLNWNYDSAIESFERALDAQPTSSEFLVGLASGYYERAILNNRPSDYAVAIELLSRALIRSPYDAIALYNRAIISERAQLYNQALDDWERYLQVDRSGPWADQARRHVATIRDKLRRRETGASKPLLGPEVLASIERAPREPSAELDARVEEYMHQAICKWLPTGFPDIARSPNRGGDPVESRNTLKALADVTERRHGDTWLKDLLAGASTTHFAEAVAALAAALEANGRADYTASRLQAKQAEHYFLLDSNTAGALRARFEAVYALHLSHDSSSCLEAINTVNHQLARKNYAWLQIQYAMEQGNCKGIAGDLGGDEDDNRHAMARARQARYLSSYLRAVGFLAEDAAESRNVSLAWSYAQEGLSRFWTESSTVMAGYNLYTDLDTAAEVAHQPFVQASIWKQALPLVDSQPDLLLQAMAHRWAANAAYAAGLDGTAEQEFSLASKLVSRAPKSAAVQNDIVASEIWMARLEAHRGFTDLATRRLESVQSYIRGSSDSYISIRYYTVLGLTSMRSGKIKQAEGALRSAVALAEYTLSSLKSDDEKLKWNSETSDAYRGLVQLQLMSGDPRGAIESWEWYRAASVGTRPAMFSVQSMAASNLWSAQALAKGLILPIPTRVSTVLPRLSGRAVVAYALLPNGLEAWEYDANGIHSFLLAVSSDTIRRLAQRFIGNCADPASPDEEWKAEARLLYDVLISPIQSSIGQARELVIETDGFLAGLPFEALIDSHDRYLSDMYLITATNGLYEQTEDHAFGALDFRHDSALIVDASAAVKNSRDTPVLTDTGDEARTIAGYFQTTRNLNGQAVTIQSIRSELAKREVFHFAGHSAVVAGATELLLPDEMLGVGQIREFDLKKVKLVTLASCSTDRTTIDTSEELVTIARTFLSKGVPHVVGSRWNVDSGATSLFMKSFYRILATGRSVPESVRAAGMEIRSKENMHHPYFWCAFGAFGRIVS